MNVNWRPYDEFDPFESAMNPDVPRYYFLSFGDYLKTIAVFVENERKKNNQEIEDHMKNTLSEETQAEEFSEHDYYAELLERGFAEFENTLFSSFFIMIYSHMETELIRYCRDLEKRDPQRVKLSDLAGKSGVVKSMNYLTKVQQIEFSLENSLEWMRIKGFQNLRNCIVHSQGSLDEFEKRDELSKFIRLKDSKIKLQDDAICILDRDFCSDALVTMEKFLNAVASAKKPKVV